ncbi:hypothetical protein FA95DRAFT_655479 [Auriscalpium vulgare]|uniref:Uncharacterized protein n=1 Tax=Auriscalpium vulgare TaxID=40419 RepID=A0ACB8RC86_9AGAM|nr:hypothetical protein FA95DRAFT_655479 [Auriscalpium vulgare]
MIRERACVRWRSRGSFGGGKKTCRVVAKSSAGSAIDVPAISEIRWRPPRQPARPQRSHCSRSPSATAACFLAYRRTLHRPALPGESITGLVRGTTHRALSWAGRFPRGSRAHERCKSTGLSADFRARPLPFRLPRGRRLRRAICNAVDDVVRDVSPTLFRRIFDAAHGSARLRGPPRVRQGRSCSQGRSPRTSAFPSRGPGGTRPSFFARRPSWRPVFLSLHRASPGIHLVQGAPEIIVTFVTDSRALAMRTRGTSGKVRAAI